MPCHAQTRPSGSQCQWINFPGRAWLRSSREMPNSRRLQAFACADLHMLRQQTFTCFGSNSRFVGYDPLRRTPRRMSSSVVKPVSPTPPDTPVSPISCVLCGMRLGYYTYGCRFVGGVRPGRELPKGLPATRGPAKGRPQTAGASPDHSTRRAKRPLPSPHSAAGSPPRGARCMAASRGGGAVHPVTPHISQPVDGNAA